jgi:hypothetical protein
MTPPQRQVETVQRTFERSDLTRSLNELETRYRMSSETFRTRWRAGELDHGDFELNRWWGLLELADRARAG